MLCSSIRNKRKGQVFLSFILLFIIFITFAQISYAQYQNKVIKDLIANHNSNKNNFTKILQPHNLGIQIRYSILPKANIHTSEGYYRLNSKLHSSFSAGLNYIINLNNLWGIYSGLYLNITKGNFYKNIQNSDLMVTGIVRSQHTPPLIYYKDIYFRVVVPVMAVRRFHFHKFGFWDIQAGINLNYSGFSGDEGIIMSVGDTNNHQVNVFNADFKSNNNLKPWVSLSLGTSKNLLLKNKNLVAFSLFLELSQTDFLKSDYEITIPNKPITRGTYSVTGSGMGLSVQYIFTGTNKRLVRNYQKNVL